MYNAMEYFELLVLTHRNSSPVYLTIRAQKNNILSRPTALSAYEDTTFQWGFYSINDAVSPLRNFQDYLKFTGVVLNFHSFKMYTKSPGIE